MSSTHAAAALTLNMLNRPAEAESYARRSVRLEPKYVNGNFALAYLLVMQDKLTPEALTSLQIASNSNTGARWLL